MSIPAPSYGGKIDPRNVQFSRDEKILAKAIDASGPVKCIVDGVNAFINHGLRTIWTSLVKVADKPPESNDTRDILYYIEPTGYTYGPYHNPYKAVQQKATYTGTLTGRLVMLVNGKRYESDEYNMMEMPAILGSVLDKSASEPEKLFDQGNCPYYPQGTVIIKGVVKHVLHQSKVRNNLVMIYRHKEDDNASCSNTFVDARGIPSKIIMYAGNEGIEKKSKTKKAKQQLLEEPNNKDVLYIHTPIIGVDDKFKNKIPVYHAFSVLGDYSTNDITDLILSFIPEDDVALVAPLLKANTASKRETVLEDTKRRFHIDQDIDLEYTLVDQIYPIVQHEDRKKKAEMLAYMTAQFMMYRAGLRNEDDRDVVGYTRIETPEILMLRFCAVHLKSKYEDLTIEAPSMTTDAGRNKSFLNAKAQTIFALVTKKIGEELISVFGTGKWTVKSAKGNAGGELNETIQPESLIKTFALMTKNSVPVRASGKQIRVRVFNNSQSKYNDAKDSHEGETIGLNRQLTDTCYLSTTKIPDVVYDLLIGATYEDGAQIVTETKDEYHPHAVLLNGVVIGRAYGPDIVALCREQKKLGGVLREYFDMMVCFNEHYGEVQIDTSAGRMTRPMLIATEDGSGILMDRDDYEFEEMLDRGFVEYVDAYQADFAGLFAMTRDYQKNRWDEIHLLEKTGKYKEALAIRLGIENYHDDEEPMPEDELNILIAKRKLWAKYTHVELSASTGDGVAGSLIPGANHNLSSKNAFACNMAKQTVSAHQSTYRVQGATTLKFSANRSRPCFDTLTTESFGLNTIPNAQTVTVAFDTGKGNSINGGVSQEDAVETKQTLIDRGAYSYFVVHQIKYENLGGLHDLPGTVVIGLPDVRNNKYEHLDSRGIVKTSVNVKKWDVLIARKTRGSDGEYVQDDVIMHQYDEGIVDDVIAIKAGDVYTSITIKIREHRKPIKGTKFSTRQGQKGVVGSVTAERNMPRTADGLTPDFTIDPLGFLSRQTYSLQIEMVQGSVAAYTGTRRNGTSFCDDFSMDTIIDVMKKNAVGNRYHAVQMYDGKTGRPLPRLTYVGQVYMLLLHHTPEDKANFQEHVATKLVSNQSEKGKRQGGLTRFGELETNTIIATGAAATHHAIYSYDNLWVALGSGCGTIISPGIDGTFQCPICPKHNRACTSYRVNFSGANRHFLQQVSMQATMISNYPSPVTVPTPAPISQ